MKVCIVGASGKLGKYMVQHCLERGYEVTGVCREVSAHKLELFGEQITIYPGNTNDRNVIKRAVQGCDAVLTVLVPWGMNQYATGTAQAVMDFARTDARLIFSCGWHITKDGKDQYSKKFLLFLRLFRWFGRAIRMVDLNDQDEACHRVFSSQTRWTVVRGSSLEEGESEGLPVWCEHVGDPLLASDITRRIDYALFMVEAITNEDLLHKAPAIVSRASASANAHATNI